MITVSGSAQRSFVFPANLPIAYAYFGDVSRNLTYHPHIYLVRAYGPDRFRLLYSTTELGTYRIRIYADVQTMLEEGWVIRIHPLPDIPPSETRAKLNSSTTQGYFQSRSVFHDESGQTRIEYNVELRASLPRPLGLRFMPGAMIDRIASGITKHRMREIIEGFIERSVSAFPHWLAEMENPGGAAMPTRPGPAAPKR